MASLSWENMALPLPKESAKAIGETSRRPGPRDHVGLWLDKLIYRFYDTKKPREFWSLKKDAREFALQQFARKWRVEAGEEALRRRHESLESTHGKLFLPLYAKVQGRLLVDYGRANAAETTLSFHHTWGVPRIPGSALKGITRAWMCAQGASQADMEAIFGRPPRRERSIADSGEGGHVLFFDALPDKGTFSLALDVLTPHYNKYYRDGEPPGDWDSPVPHTFLTVVDTTFVIHLAAEPRDDISADHAQALLEQTGKALAEALSEHGVGAKTSAGYGRLAVVPPPPSPALQELAAWLEAFRAANVPQRTVLERVESEWLTRLIGLSVEDRQCAAQEIKKSIKSPKLAERLQELIDKLSKP